MIINIRGTNGSGKTHLARQLIAPDPTPVDLNWYQAPTKKDPERKLRVEGWGHPGETLAIGSYRQGCGGMDTIPSFEIQQMAIICAQQLPVPPQDVVCEGVLASTVAGSWLDFFKKCAPERGPILIAYLDTPLELCLERITARQIAAKGEAREIKIDLVKNKIKAIEATRAKFKEAGIMTVTIRHDRALDDIREAIQYGRA